ncbi:AAA+ ATPase domain-containing protein [Artemisia annua]|uniref:AAA+ ATPase domain-containing protein n=1 Tax=Artemisia annua TaxID=35608 RepID=A0A2U1LEI9_ARTAN|nr:AAA+ ATPase domain-containing protein [Artemisia annua]
MSTANQSVLVAEDIDCSVELNDQLTVMLSGFLNSLTDCGQTYDDVHIHISYCTPCGFRLLASNYLGINQHDLLKQIQDLMLEINVTPAEVAEQLLKDDDPSVVLSGLLEFFVVKRKEKEDEEARKRKKIQPREK